MKTKILIAHVPYQTRGGEDVHVSMLQDAYAKIGVETVLYPGSSVTGGELLARSFQSLLPTAAFPEFEKFYKSTAPAAIHLHNAFPLLGPRFFRWVEKNKIPLIYTIHNHRFFCTNGLALREEKNCRACMHTIPWQGLLHNCNGAWDKTLYHFLSLSELRLRDQLNRSVSLFIAPSPYIRDQLIQFGIDQKKIRVLVHACEAKPAPALSKDRYDVIYAGRLSQEKGVISLLETIRKLPQVKFLVLGDGPEASRFRESGLANLEYRANASHSEVLDAIAQSRVGVIPSLCNEILSLFSLELFVHGKRCVMSKTESSQWFQLQSLPCTYFETGNSNDLARAIEECLQLPLLAENNVERMRILFGVPRFLQELKAVVTELTKQGSSP